MKGRFVFLLIIILVLPFFAACSINKMAINAVSDGLTGEGSSDVFTGDSDPQLVGDALPFAIKMYESLLSGNPNHQGLILTTGSLFVMYANAFVQGPAELLPREQYAERQAAMERAKKLYLRGADIVYGGLEKKYPGFSGSSRTGDFPKILAKMKKPDVPYLYWAAAGYLSAYSLNPFDMELGVKIPELISLVNRAYELDPDFNSGALDDFFVLAYASLPESMGGNKSLVESHFQRALEKSGGRLAGPYVSYASAVSIPAQDYDTFKLHLETALALDPDADPANRLVNILSQRKARYLLDNAGLYFIDFDTGEIWEDEDYN
ncbi:MAG: TRAP transporter TatT component family protein [Treponema sp.]|jgi:predicted anti-sigma-YlaC factor YlaD|nr:TRAP transporter TatT component family protein [Treponema sp.]